MGLHWSTPHVMGVGYTAHLGPRRSVGCLPLLVFFLAFGVLTSVVHAWYVFLPLLVVLAWSIRWMKQQQTAAALNPPNRLDALNPGRRR
jgi:hypothetical protein